MRFQFMKSNGSLRLSRALVVATLLGLLALALILAQPPIAKAQSCSNATLNGAYGYRITGFFLPHQGAAAGSALVGVSIGVETFDGNGNTFVSETLNAALGIFPQTLTGTYTIHPDCTGSGTVTFPDGGTGTALFIVVDAGNEIEFLNTWFGVVEFGIVKKQAIANGVCTNATLNGTYGYVLEGLFQANPHASLGGASIAGSIGIETFDGNGNTFGSETVHASGETFQQTFTGTYDVNADCTGSITRNLSNGLTTGSLSIVDGGREIEVANRANTLIEFGSLKKQ